MDIHKPKSWHGWREFLKEVGTIVLGVLIALGAEQVVANLHESRLAAEARETIRGEIVTDITRIRQRANADDCVTARLAELDRIIDAAGVDGRIRPPSWIGRPPRHAIESERWDAASQSGRISLLPSDWQSHFGFIYASLRYYYEMNMAEQSVWSRLDALRGVDRLSPDGKLSLKADIAQAQFLNRSMHQVADIIADRAAREGLRPTNRRDPPHSVCWPIDTPYAKGLARADASYFGSAAIERGR